MLRYCQGGMLSLSSRPGLRLTDLPTSHARGRLQFRVRAAGTGRSKPTPGTRAKEKDKVKEAAAAARLARLLQLYGGEEAVAEQQAEVAIYLDDRDAELGPGTAGRRLPRREAGKFDEKVAEVRTKRERMFRTDPATRLVQANVGLHGGGEVQWWALSVQPGREKQVCDALARMLPNLPPVVDWDSGEEVDRVGAFKTWAPVKKVKAWNPKTGRMGNRQVRYDNGGWVLMRTIMDQRLAALLARNVNFLGFRDREQFEGTDFPRPVAASLVEELRVWEEDLADIGEEEMRKMLELPPKTELSAEDGFFYAADLERQEAALEERRTRDRDDDDSGRWERSDGGRGRGGRGRDGGRGRGRGREAHGSAGLYRAGDDDYTPFRGDGGSGSGWYDGGAAAALPEEAAGSGGGWFTSDGASGDSAGWFDGAAAAAAAREPAAGAVGAAGGYSEAPGGDEREPRGGLSDMWGSGSEDVWSGVAADASPDPVPGPVSDDSDAGWWDSGEWAAAATEGPAASTQAAPFSAPDVWGSADQAAPPAPAPSAAAPTDDLWGTGDIGGSGFGGWLDDFTAAEAQGAGDASIRQEQQQPWRDGREEEGRGRQEWRRDGDRERDARGRQEWRRDDDRERDARGRQEWRRDDDRERDARSRQEWRQDDDRERDARGRGARRERDREWSPRGRDGDRGRDGGRRDDWHEGSPRAEVRERRGAWEDDRSPGGGDDLSWWDDVDVGAGGTAAKAKAAEGAAAEPSFVGGKAAGGAVAEGEPQGGAEPLQPGSPIAVVSGHFKDFEGVVLEGGQEGGRVRAELDVFGKQTVVEVAAADLERLPPSE